MNILVTGGSGFIGTNLINHLLSHQNINILNVDIVAPRNELHSDLWVNVDILDHVALDDLFNDVHPDYVVHLAARTDLNGKNIEDYAENTDGVRNIVRCIKSYPPVKRAIFASSMLVCELGYIPSNDGDYCPNTPYGMSKVVGENIVKEELSNKYDWVIVRPTSLWGPWFDVPYKNFFDAVQRGYYVHPKGIDVKRSYGFVLNSIDQLCCLLEGESSSVSNNIFYLADYSPISILEWGNEIQNEFGSSKIKSIPYFFMRLFAYAGDMLKIIGVKTPPISSFRLRNMVTSAVYNTRDLEHVCPNQKYTMKEGVVITVDWLINNK